MALTATATRGVNAFTVGEELTIENLNSLGVPTIAIDESNAAITGGVMSGVIITLPSYSVASLPAAGTAGRIVYCTDGDASNPCLAVDDGSYWDRVVLGNPVSA